MSRIDAIVPAHNEATTVYAVARALIDSGLFGAVIVVDDGSSDATAAEAARAGADVVRLAKNRGKAAAMLAGVARSPADAIAFFDADAVSLTSDHARLLVEHFRLGFTQVCGIQDHGLLNPLYAVTAPLLTGQRVVQRWVLERLPTTCGGYSVEMAINYVVEANGGSTCVLFLKGATFRDKTSKLGFWQGTLRNLRMMREIEAAHRALSASHGATCSTGDHDGPREAP